MSLVDEQHKTTFYAPSFRLRHLYSLTYELISTDKRRRPVCIPRSVKVRVGAGSEGGYHQVRTLAFQRPLGERLCAGSFLIPFAIIWNALVVFGFFVVWDSLGPAVALWFLAFPHTWVGVYFIFTSICVVLNETQVSIVTDALAGSVVLKVYEQPMYCGQTTLSILQHGGGWGGSGSDGSADDKNGRDEFTTRSEYEHIDGKAAQYYWNCRKKTKFQLVVKRRRGDGTSRTEGKILDVARNEHECLYLKQEVDDALSHAAAATSSLTSESLERGDYGSVTESDSDINDESAAYPLV